MEHIQRIIRHPDRALGGAAFATAVVGVIPVGVYEMVRFLAETNELNYRPDPVSLILLATGAVIGAVGGTR